MILPAKAVVGATFAAAFSLIIRLPVAVAGECPDEKTQTCWTGTKEECNEKGGCAADDVDCCCVHYTIPYCGVPSDCNGYLKCHDPSAAGLFTFSEEPTTLQIVKAFQLLELAHENAEFDLSQCVEEAHDDHDHDHDHEHPHDKHDDDHKDEKKMGMDGNATDHKDDEKMGMESNGNTTDSDSDGNTRALRASGCPEYEGEKLCLSNTDCTEEGDCCVAYTLPYCGVPSDCNEYLGCMADGVSVSSAVDPTKELKEYAFGFIREVVMNATAVADCVIEDPDAKTKGVEAMSGVGSMYTLAAAAGLAAAASAVLVAV